MKGRWLITFNYKLNKGHKQFTARKSWNSDRLPSLTLEEAGKPIFKWDSFQQLIGWVWPHAPEQSGAGVVWQHTERDHGFGFAVTEGLNHSCLYLWTLKPHFSPIFFWCSCRCTNTSNSSQPKRPQLESRLNLSSRRQCSIRRKEGSHTDVLRVTCVKNKAQLQFV